ncbi:MAG: hypothetical protein ACTSRP_01260 [Candidatus Helarchaeota archaeon]
MSNHNNELSKQKDTTFLSFIYPSLYRKWDDFTETHKKIRIEAEYTLNQYIKSINENIEATPPLIIAGGFGSGKSQLLLHLFKYTWSNNTPCLYINLKDVLRIIKRNLLAEGIDTKLDAKEFIDYLTKISFNKLERILDSFNDEENYYDVWLPNSERHTAKIKLNNYFKKINLDQNKIINVITETLERDYGIIILIDEVEMAYNELKEMVEGNVILREMTDIIGKLGTKIYLVFAVGYLSYYELFLSEFTGETAGLRRIKLIQIPPIDPDILYLKLAQTNLNKEKVNILWWFSRGRLGWINFLKDVVMINDNNPSDLLEWIKLQQLKTPISEGLTVIDIEEIYRREKNLCSAKDLCKAAIYNFLLNIYPRKIEDLPEFIDNKILNAISPMLIFSNELIDINKIINSIIADIEEYYINLGVEKLSDKIRDNIIKALYDILSAFSIRIDSSKKLCFGSSDMVRSMRDLQNYIKSTLDLTITYMAENFGTDNEILKASEFLYHVTSTISIDENWIRNFNKTRELFSQNIGKSYVLLAPWELENFIPMYLSNPIISTDPSITLEKLEEKVKDYYNEFQVQELFEIITKISQYICNIYNLENQNSSDLILIIPYLKQFNINQNIIEKLIELINYVINKKYHDILTKEKSFLGIYFTNINRDDLNKIINELNRSNEIFNILNTYLFRIEIKNIPNERLSNFIKSIFIMTSESLKKQYSISIEEIIRELKPEHKRRAEYLKNTTFLWIDNNLKNFKKEHKYKIKDNKLTKLNDIFLDDIKNINIILNRGRKFRFTTKLYSILFSVLNEEVRKVFDYMQKSLIGGSIIKFKSIPSIYQEFQYQRKLHCKCIQKILSNSLLIHNMIKLISSKIKNQSFSDIITYLETNSNIQFYKDFLEILRNTFPLNIEKYENELQYLYKVLILQNLIIERYNEIINNFLNRYQSVDSIIKELNQLIEHIDTTCKKIYQISKMKINLQYKNLSKSSNTNLIDEINGIKKCINELNTWANNIKNKAESENQIYAIAFIILFGLPEDDIIFLNQIENKLNEWYENLSEKVKDPLNKLYNLILNNDLNKILIKQQVNEIKINYNISSIDDIKTLERYLNEFILEIEKIFQNYNILLSKFDNLSNLINEKLHEIYDSIKNIIKRLTNFCQN